MNDRRPKKGFRRMGLLVLLAVSLFFAAAPHATAATERIQISTVGCCLPDFQLYVYDSQGNIASGPLEENNKIPNSGYLNDDQSPPLGNGAFRFTDSFTDFDEPSIRRFCFGVSVSGDAQGNRLLMDVTITDPGGGQRSATFLTREGTSWTLLGGSPLGSELNGGETAGDAGTCGPGKPQTRTCKKPRRETRSGRACFRITPKESNASLECRLTGKGVPKKLKGWSPCRSPKSYRSLKPGKKVFQARAVDSVGAGSKPGTHKWTVLPRGK